MTTISIADARKRLSEIIRSLDAGDEIVITDNRRPVARLLPPDRGLASTERSLGSMRGTVIHMASDFDAPLDDFQEYMA